MATVEGANRIRQIETRAAPGGELRVSGRTVSGVVMRYGDVADMGAFREQFLPGAFGSVDQINAELNVMHQETRRVARTGGGGLVFRDTSEALLMSATLPTTREADETLQLIRSGRLRGLSVEFRAIADKFRDDLREIASAALSGLGLVDRPAYSGSAGLEVRRESDRQRQERRRALWVYL